MTPIRVRLPPFTCSISRSNDLSRPSWSRMEPFSSVDTFRTSSRSPVIFAVSVVKLINTSLSALVNPCLSSTTPPRYMHSRVPEDDVS